MEVGNASIEVDHRPRRILAVVERRGRRLQTRPAEGKLVEKNCSDIPQKISSVGPKRPRFAIQRLACLLSHQDTRRLHQPKWILGPKLDQLHLLLSRNRNHDPVADAFMLPTLIFGVPSLSYQLSPYLHQHHQHHNSLPLLLSHTHPSQKFSKLADSSSSGDSLASARTRC